MVSLKREVLNGKTVLEIVLTALPVLQGEIQVVTKIKDMAGSNLLSTHCYIHRQNLASKKMAPELNGLTGKNSGLVTKIKDIAGSNLLSTHCYIHRQNLASKKMAPELNEVLSQSVKIINYIKNSALNTRLLKALCDEMGSDLQNLLFDLEVRWLSYGEVLKRLYGL